MTQPIDRREFLKLAGLGGAVFASGLAGCAGMAGGKQEEFYFVQLSDTHWGFKGAALNPDAGGTLQKAVAAVNALPEQPDFIVFTGDLTHTTDDPKERRRRLAEFKDIVSGAEEQEPALHAGRARRLARQRRRRGRSSSGRATTASTTRACTSSPSTTSPTPRRASARSSSPG